MDSVSQHRAWPEWKANLAGQGSGPTTIATHHPENVRRTIAADRTAQRFSGRVWSWADGATCAHLARFHLRQLGLSPEPMPRLRSTVAAHRALAARGWEDVADMLDAQPSLARIMPADMLPGDLAAFPTPDGAGTIAVFLDR